MVSKILAPVDGTKTAEAALPWIEHVGLRTGASIHLFTALDGSLPQGEPAAGPSGNNNKASKAYLEALQASLQEKGLRAEVEVATGPAADLILATAETESADVTVMTYGTSRWILGSVLDKVLQEMTRPVLVVRAHGKENVQREITAEKILVPIDSSTYSSLILPIAKQVAEALGMTIVLCHTIAAPGKYRDVLDAPPGVARAMQELLDEAHALLNKSARSIVGDCRIETVTAFGQAEEEIPRLAERNGADLIAMATRGRERLDRRIMGSVANGVVQRTKLPCLFTRPTQPE